MNETQSFEKINQKPSNNLQERKGWQDEITKINRETPTGRGTTPSKTIGRVISCIFRSLLPNEY